MKHIFVINPAAGKGQGLRMRENIESIAGKLGIEPIFYNTRGIGDAKEFVKEFCDKNSEDELLRFYSCGGDGTLNEVVNGTFGIKNAEIAAFPAGTGNDFVRNFDGKDFADIESQMLGESIPIDLIYYEYELCEKNNGVFDTSGYGINMFNIGFDADVVDITQKYKKIPFLEGHLAYLAGVFKTFIFMKGIDVTVKCDGEIAYDGELLLTALANGAYCGGGVKGVPTARVDDGLMDVSMIKRISRLNFAKLFPEYKDGSHLNNPKAMNVIKIKQGKSVSIESRKEPFTISVDGEIVYSKKLELKVVPMAANFVIPNI